MSNEIQPKSREEWFELVKEQEVSGLSQTAFCKQRSLIQCRFGYYQKKYREQEGLASNKAGSFSTVEINQSINKPNNDIKIELPNGFRCSVPNSIETDKLKKLLAVILSC